MPTFCLNVSNSVSEVVAVNWFSRAVTSSVRAVYNRWTGLDWTGTVDWTKSA